MFWTNSRMILSYTAGYYGRCLGGGIGSGVNSRILQWTAEYFGTAEICGVRQDPSTVGP